MIKLYLANLGKYNEGILKGEWVELPLSETELEEVMVNIGVAHYDKEGNFVPYVIETDEKGYEYVYEEYAIHDYETDLNISISEYSSLDNLNTVAEIVEDFELDQVNALLDDGAIGMKDLIEGDLEEIMQNYTFVELEPNMNEEQEVGYAYVDEVCGGPEYLSKEILERYFDYEAFGRDILLSGEGFVSGNILVLK